jgi:hypothetical protein
MTIKVDDWQKEILDYHGDFLLCTGRRVGKTYIVARKAIDRMLKKRISVVVVSLTEEQAQLIITMALNYTREVAPAQISKKKIDTNKKTIRLKNGSVMYCRPVGNLGDSLRGFEAHILIVDEAARMPRLFWISALPLILTTAGEIWLCSTPFGKQGYFWERFDESYNKQIPTARFKCFYTSTERVINERPISATWTAEQREGALRILAEDRRTMTAVQYGQEYMGLFMEDLNQFFPDELIDKQCVLKRPNVFPQNNVFSGHDIARFGGDEITHEFIFKKGESDYIQIENIVKKGQDTYTTEQEIIQLSKIYNVDKVGIDAGSGSLGVGIFDNLMQDATMKRKVVAMNNRTISLERDGKKSQRIFKEDMYENLKVMLETGQLKLLDDDNIKLSLKSIQKEFNTTGLGISVKIYGSYSHIAEGLIRACWLAKKQKINKLWIRYF